MTSTQLVQDMHPDAELDPLRAQLEGSAYRGHDGRAPDARRLRPRTGPSSRSTPRTSARPMTKSSCWAASAPAVGRAESTSTCRSGLSGPSATARSLRAKTFSEQADALPGRGPRVAPPPEPGSRPDGGGRLLRRGDRRHRRGDRRGRAAESLLQRAGAGGPPGRAGRALPVAVRAVRRRRPGGRLRGRGDGPVRVRGRLRGRRRGADLGADPGPAVPRPAACRGALRRALDRDPGHRAVVARHRGADGAGRLRLSGGDRQPAAGALPDRLRGGLDAPAGRRRRRGGPGRDKSTGGLGYASGAAGRAGRPGNRRSYRDSSSSAEA